MRSRPPALPALIIVLFVALFLAPQLVGGKVLATGSLAQWLPWRAQAAASGGDAALRAAETSFNPDCLTSYYPRRALFRQAWQDGEIPLWNPYSFCGTPFLADPQAQVLYPPSWLLLLFDPANAMGWFVFLHLAGAGVGAWLLLRRRDVGELVALLGGCAFALSGFFMKHFGLPPFLATVAWMPWWILAIEDAVDRPGLMAAARLAVVGALSFLAGQPQIAMMMAYGGALHGMVYALGRPRGSELRWGSIGLTAVGAALVALLMVSAQLLPTLELAARSARARLPYETVLSGAFHPVDALRFLVPDFFGTPTTRDEWSPLFPGGDSFYLRTQLNSLFAGTPVFLFAVVGMMHPRTWRRALPFTAVFVVMSLIAFGGPVARFAHAFLPGFSFARLDRAGGLIVFAQLVPAGLAAAQLRDAGRAARISIGAGMLAVAAAGVAGVTLAGTDLPLWMGAQRAASPEVLEGLLARTPGRTTMAALFAAGAGLAWWLPFRSWLPALPFALAAAQLTLLAAPYRGDREPDEIFASAPEIEQLQQALDVGAQGGTRFVRFGRSGAGRSYPLSDILPPSTNAPHGLRDLQGYNALADRRLGDALEQATGEPLFSHGIWGGRRIVALDEAASLEHPLLDALSVGVAVSNRPIDADGWSPLPAAGSFAMEQNSGALPRVRLVSRGRGLGPDEMAHALETGNLQPADEVLWLTEPGSAEAPVSAASGAGSGLAAEPVLAASGGGSGATVEVLVDSWNRLTVRTHSEQAAFLVVADSYDPGWQVVVDGDRATLRAAWGVVRAVPLGPGGHLVEMAYRPASFRRGCALSLLGLLLAGSAMVIAPGGRPRKSAST